jgi:N-acetylglucosaminyl-diphospho-decaprenol L-rhamnosyltransferase
MSDAVAIDAVVVSYNSRGRLRPCVEPLLASGVNVIVVDSASPDASLDEVRDLPLEAVQLGRNGGFAYGVNRGWPRGDAPYVLLLNPDARIDEASLAALVQALEQDASLAAAAPRLVADDGRLEFSQRRFPCARSTFARALFLHRLFPRAAWSDELLRDPRAYEHAALPDWVSGACVLVRRTALERLGGLDEGFFMYCEDTDLCRRLRDLGQGIRFEPAATAVHEGGASAPRAALLPVLTESRIRYARKHLGRAGALAERLGLALEAATRMLLARGGGEARSGHRRALRAALKGRARRN